MFVQFIANGLVVGSLYAVATLGFALVYNVTRIFHLVYAALFMLSGYFLYTFIEITGFSLMLSAVLTAIAIGLTSLFTETAIYQPLIRLHRSPNVIMVASLGLMIIIVNVIAMLFGNGSIAINSTLGNNVSFAGMIFSVTQLVQLFISSMIIALFILFLKGTNWGVIARAVRDDPTLASVFGINVKRFRLVLFFVSGVLVAIPGMLMSYDVGFDPHYGMAMLLNVVTALVIGGIGRFDSAIYGGLILGVLQSISTWLFPANWQNTIVFLVLVAFILFRPKGLFPDHTRVV